MPRSRTRKRPTSISKLSTIPETGPPDECVAMTVDAAYFIVLMRSGKINIGHRAQRDEPGIVWSEAEPVPGTLRAREIAKLRDVFAAKVKEELDRAEAKDKA